MKSIIYICGQGHSGSTLLDLVLGGHSRLIGLGEVCKLVQPGELERRHLEQKFCSCGHSVAECSFWGRVLDTFTVQQAAVVRDRYRLVIDNFSKIYGEDVTPVDSSKYLPCLKTVRDIGYNLKVVRLTRDVRAYAVSYIDNAKKKNLPYMKQLCIYQFYIWYKNNRMIDDYLKRNSISYIDIGYENLCMSTDSTLHQLCDYIGMPYENGMVNIGESKSHVLVGNRMRRTAEKKSGIEYDNRWFSRREWLLPSLLFPMIIRYNANRVYGNAVGQKWKNI